MVVFERNLTMPICRPQPNNRNEDMLGGTRFKVETIRCRAAGCIGDLAVEDIVLVDPDVISMSQMM